MSRHSLLRGALSALFALSLSQCQSAPPAATDASTLRDAADGDDSGEAPGVARLDYQPEGCMHRVHTSEGTYGNYRGDRATFGANPAPRGVHVTWPADPATTVTVTLENTRLSEKRFSSTKAMRPTGRPQWPV